LNIQIGRSSVSFKTAAKADWFKNTLFVIAADHATEEIQYPQYNTVWGYFSIPLIFYRPGREDMGMKDELVQQVDILPSILGYLGYDQPYVAFGRNVFSSKDRPFAFNYLNNTYQFFQGNYLLQFDGQNSIALFDFKADPFLKNNEMNVPPDTVSEMQARLRALIQQYNNRMVDDNLTREVNWTFYLRRKIKPSPTDLLSEIMINVLHVIICFQCFDALEYLILLSLR
jgi:hypothetical protein